MIDPDDIAEDDSLTPGEKETTLSFAKDRDTARVFTAEAALMRRVVAHPHAEVVDSTEKGENVVAITAELPVGCLTVSGSPRETGGHADVITSSVLRS